MHNDISILDEYIASDERLQASGVKAELIANGALNFDRLMKIGKGTLEIHEIDFNGQIIPMRLLSMMEETELSHATIIDIERKYPAFKGQIKDMIFNKLYLIKQISRATTVNSIIATCKEIKDTRRLTEDEVGNMSPSEFAYLVSEYQNILKQYNPIINDINDEEIDFLIGEMLNPEKKSITISGLTSVQMKGILMKLSDILLKLEDNMSITSSLIDTSSINESKNQTEIY